MTDVVSKKGKTPAIIATCHTVWNGKTCHSPLFLAFYQRLLLVLLNGYFFGHYFTVLNNLQKVQAFVAIRNIDKFAVMSFKFVEYVLVNKLTGGAYNAHGGFTSFRRCQS